MELNKKGALEIITVMVTIIVLFIIIMVMHKAWTEMADKFQESPMAESIPTNATLEMADNLVSGFDVIGLAAFICLVVVVLVLAMLIPANPAYIGLFIIIGVIAVIIAVPFSNMWEEFSLNSEMASTTNALPITSFIMANLPLIVAALIGLLLVVTYAKGGVSGEH